VAVTHGWPEAGRRLRANGPGTVDAWITVVFGIGARVGSLTTENVVLRAPDGEPAPYRLHHSRWTGRADDATRLLRIEPTAELQPDATYTLEVGPGVELQDGTLSEDIWVFQIRTACVDAAAPGCEAAEDAPFPPPPPHDAGLDVDAGPGDLGPGDAGLSDQGIDGNAGDSGLEDAGLGDARTQGGDHTDSGRRADAAVSGTDAGGGANPSDASGPAETGGGGGCAQASAPSPAPTSSAGWLWALMGLASLQRRRKSHAKHGVGPLG
jgi:hypothetical protein